MDPRVEQVKRIKINGREIDLVEAEVDLFGERGRIEGYTLTFETTTAVKEALEWMSDSKIPPSEIEFVLCNCAETYRGRSYIMNVGRLTYKVEGNILQKIQ